MLSVIAKDGSSACVIDTQVYGNNQQYRCMGCSKGGKRTLVAVQGTPTFADSLVVPAHRTPLLLPLNYKNSGNMASPGASNMVPVPPLHPANVPATDKLCCPSLAHYIRSCLGPCTVYKNATLHTSYGASSASLYLYTTCKQCPRKMHSNNTIKVEVCFRIKAWRALCRSESCLACGKWVRLPAEVLSEEARLGWSVRLQTWAEKWL